MDEDEMRTVETRADEAAEDDAFPTGEYVAQSLAGTMFGLLSKRPCVSWIAGGDWTHGDIERDIWEEGALLATFARSAPGCSGETLFRWAAGQGLHGLDVEAWRTPALEATRGAYTLFAYVLPFADAILAERRAARAEAQPPAPILMAESETVLARLDGPLQRIDAPPAQVAIGAPAKAAIGAPAQAEPDATKPAKSARKGKSAA